MYCDLARYVESFLEDELLRVFGKALKSVILVLALRIVHQKHTSMKSSTLTEAWPGI